MGGSVSRFEAWRPQPVVIAPGSDRPHALSDDTRIPSLGNFSSGVQPPHRGHGQTAQIPTPVFAMEAAAAIKNSPGVRWQAKRDTALFSADNERSEAADGSRSSHAKTPRPKDTRVQPWGLWVLA